MSTKYAWHPDRRPPPADPSLAGRIATIGPVGKCLEAALDELLAEDDRTTVASDDSTADDGGGRRAKESAEGHVPSSKKRKRTTEEIAVAGREPGSEGSVTDETSSSGGENDRVSESASDIRMDGPLSKSILESYGKAVVATEFDRERNASLLSTARPGARKSPGADAAPPAMLKGEIDHYNRVGGQWRIVVKNAVLKTRSMTWVNNGKPGRSRRKRIVLDWDDDGDGDGDDDNAREKGESTSGDGDACDKSDANSDVYHFEGKLQILAYDDT